MTRTVVQVQAGNLAAEFRAVIHAMVEKNLVLVGKAVKDLPRRFRNRAIAESGNYFVNRTTHLRNMIKELMRTEGDHVLIGLKDSVNYAAPIHEGSKPHDIGPIYPKHKKALYWPGALHPVGCVKLIHHPGTSPRPFLAEPIKSVTNEFFEEIKKEIKF